MNDNRNQLGNSSQRAIPLLIRQFDSRAKHEFADMELNRHRNENPQQERMTSRSRAEFCWNRQHRFSYISHAGRIIVNTSRDNRHTEPSHDNTPATSDTSQHKQHKSKVEAPYRTCLERLLSLPMALWGL